MLDTRVFGKVIPFKDLPLIFDSIRRHLAQELPEPLRETVDLSIKDRVRLLRLPNTIHEKTRLYKFIVSLDELHRFEPEQIRERARAARPLTMTDETGFLSRAEITENPQAAQFFQRIGRQLKRFTRKPFSYRFRRPADLGEIHFPCTGIEGIWESHIEAGSRNNCAIRMASELRLLGLNEDEANEKMLEWNDKNRIELPSDELRNVVRSAYQHRFPYRYSCHDDLLRRFCPLPDYDSCCEHVSSSTNPRERAERIS
jgi:hypothetical protein